MPIFTSDLLGHSQKWQIKTQRSYKPEVSYNAFMFYSQKINHNTEQKTIYRHLIYGPTCVNYINLETAFRSVDFWGHHQHPEKRFFPYARSIPVCQMWNGRSGGRRVALHVLCRLSAPASSQKPVVFFCFSTCSWALEHARSLSSRAHTEHKGELRRGLVSTRPRVFPEPHLLSPLEKFRVSSDTESKQLRRLRTRAALFSSGFGTSRFFLREIPCGSYPVLSSWFGEF